MKQSEIGTRPLLEQVDYWMGQIAMAIGRGEVRQTVVQMLQHTHKVSYEAGMKAERERQQREGS